MSIPFTEYVLPNGEKRPLNMPAEDSVEAIAKDLISNGAKFEIEVLRTGEVSMTCEIEDVEDEDCVLAWEIVPNNVMEVRKAVKRLVLEAGERYEPNRHSNN